MLDLGEVVGELCFSRAQARPRVRDDARCHTESGSDLKSQASPPVSRR